MSLVAWSVTKDTSVLVNHIEQNRWKEGTFHHTIEIPFSDWNWVTELFLEKIHLNSWHVLYNGCPFLVSLHTFRLKKVKAYDSLSNQKKFSFPKSLSHVERFVQLSGIEWDRSLKNISPKLRSLNLTKVEANQEVFESLPVHFVCLEELSLYAYHIKFIDAKFFASLRKLKLSGTFSGYEPLSSIIRKTSRLRVLILNGILSGSIVTKAFNENHSIYLLIMNVHYVSERPEIKAKYDKPAFLLGLAKKYPFLRDPLGLIAQKVECLL